MEHLIDAKNQKLGRLASRIAHILQGKQYPSYNPRIEGTDSVRVKNIQQIEVTGKKMEQKIYYRHAGKLGHLKRKKLEDVFVKDPSWVLRHAVTLMLPKNRLRAKRLKRFIIEK